MKTYQEKIKAYKDKAHIITPAPNIGEIPDIYTVSTREITADMKEDVYSADYKKDNDQYKKWRLRAKFIKSLADIAGVKWDFQECKCLENTDTRCVFQSAGGVCRPDGSTFFVKKTYAVVIQEVKEEIEDNCFSEASKNKWFSWENNKGAKQKDWENFSKAKFRKEFRQKKKYIVQTAETGAEVRVIVDLIRIKNSYTRAELQKPFVGIKVSINPNNPEIKKGLIAKHTGTVNSLYGPPPKNTYIPNVPKDELEKEEPEGEIHDYTDFIDSSFEEQYKTLEEMSKIKGYDLQGFISRSGREFSKMTEGRRIKLFQHINDLPDEDQIPF